MASQYETELRQKANQFIFAIREQLASSAKIDEKSFRDYSVAVQLGPAGKATIYYSPKRRRFKLVTSGLAKDIVEMINPVWDSLHGQINFKVEPTEPECEYQAYVDGSYDEERKDRKSVV